MARGKQEKLGYYWRYVECVGCPLRCRYRDFRVFKGDPYQQMYEMLWKDSPDAAQWQYKSRGVVLGKLHEWKRKAWDEMVRMCPGHGTDGLPEEA